jgi:hypothetical protein
MTDEETEDEGPAVELGDGEPVEGAPLARVASRLTWPQEKTGIEHKEGDAVIRTPDGPRELADVLESVDHTYFDRRQTFVDAVREVVGDGPVPTADSE